MQGGRDKALHAGRSERNEKTKVLKVGNFYQDDSCIMTGNAGPPGTEGATILKPHYTYKVGETERDVTDVCAEYLALLQRLAADAKAAKL